METQLVRLIQFFLSIIKIEILTWNFFLRDLQDYLGSIEYL